MTPEEEKDFNLKLNKDFENFIDAFPLIEMGDSRSCQTIKLRVMVEDNCKYSLGDIYFELMTRINYHRKKGKKNPKMLVHKLELTPKMNSPSFHPRRGIMITYKISHDTLKFKKKKNVLDRY